MLQDADKRYLGDTPLAIIEDKDLSQNKGKKETTISIQKDDNGKISVEEADSLRTTSRERDPQIAGQVAKKRPSFDAKAMNGVSEAKDPTAPTTSTKANTQNRSRE